MKKKATYFKRPAPPQSGHKKRCAIGQGGPLYKEKEGLHQSPCQTEKSKIESKSRRISQTFVLHSMSRTRRAVAQFLATSWIFLKVFLLVFIVCKSFAEHFHQMPARPLSTGQSSQTEEWSESNASCRPSQQGNRFCKREDLQSKDKQKIAKDLKRSGVYP